MNLDILFCIVVCRVVDRALIMALKPSQLALAVAFFGILAFVFGVIAENKKVIFSPYLVNFQGYK